MAAIGAAPAHDVKGFALQIVPARERPCADQARHGLRAPFAAGAAEETETRYEECDSTHSPMMRTMVDRLQCVERILPSLAPLCTFKFH